MANRMQFKLNQMILPITTILVVGFMIWLLGRMLVDIFVAASPSVQAAVIAAFAAIISLTVTVIRERNRAFREAHREKKIEIYSEFYDLMFEMLESSKKNTLPKDFDQDSPIVKRLSKISKGALFYGSPKVINALSSIKLGTVNPEDKLSAFRPTGRLLLAMREDIGLSNRGLNEINIHQIYVSDNLEALKHDEHP